MSIELSKPARVTRQILWIFVWVTVGFALGKELTLRRLASETDPNDATVAAGAPDRVVVTYAHATIRCVTCNTIERLIHETLDEQFAAERAAGRVTFEDVDFQQDTAFADRYGIAANCVVLRRIRDGRETGHQRLEKIWDLLEDPPAFKAYVGDAIRSDLADTDGGTP